MREPCPAFEAGGVELLVWTSWESSGLLKKRFTAGRFATTRRCACQREPSTYPLEKSPDPASLALALKPSFSSACAKEMIPFSAVAPAKGSLVINKFPSISR